MSDLQSGREEELIPTRASLISRLKDWNDQEGWMDFFETYWRLIFSVAIRAGLSEDEAQDVVQEVVISVAKHVPEFRYDPSKGSFKTWLYQIAKWRISDYLRKRSRWPEHRFAQASHDHSTELMNRVPASDTDISTTLWEEEWQRNLVEVAMHRIKNRVSPTQYQVFDLYVLKEKSVKEIQRALRVSRTQIYVAKHRISTMIKKEVQKLTQQLNCKEPPYFPSL